MYDTARGGLDSLMRGMCEFSAQTFDTFFTKQITTSLFTEQPPFGPGMDLLSLNIQRSRDHGLPGKEMSKIDSENIDSDVYIICNTTICMTDCVV